MKHKIIISTLVLLLSAPLGFAQAKVSPEEAAKLGHELTAMGAERAGNADGSIPAWSGDTFKIPSTYKKGEFLPNPWPNEKPLFTITPQNYKQYADKLSVSQIEMFKRVPTFKMDVYPTHRIANAPDWVKKNTYNAALNAKLVDGGNGVEGACGGIPFPIPKSGGEAIQNLLMRWWGQVILLSNYGISGYQDADATPTFAADAYVQFPYYMHKDGNSCGDRLLSFANTYTVPARRKGEQLVVDDFLNASKHPREAWQYIPGQRRVRRAPTIGFDTPDMAITTYDDAYLYNGSPERYDWKLLGKKEIYIPYDGYDAESDWADGKATMADMTHAYPNPNKYFRWELHRVWVVEGTLKKGERHIYAKRVFYLDEDTWTAGIEDRFDAKGQLWRYTFSNILYYYDPNEQFPQMRPLLNKDMQSGEYLLFYVSLKPLEVPEPQPEEYFAPSGLRKRARR